MQKGTDELKRHFREIARRLRTAAAAFDAGDPDQAARIAVDLRVLLHDTGASTSLLKQLGIKDSLRFLDTSGMKPSAGTLMMFGGLAHIDVVRGRHFAPLDTSRVVAQLPFNEWWDGLAVRVPDEARRARDFRRRDLVLLTANKDGGAHVDAEIDTTYFDLTRNSSLGDRAVAGRKVQWDSNPVPCALRQIAHEVIRTLEQQGPGLL